MRFLSERSHRLPKSQLELVSNIFNIRKQLLYKLTTLRLGVALPPAAKYRETYTFSIMQLTALQTKASSLVETRRAAQFGMPY